MATMAEQSFHVFQQHQHQHQRQHHDNDGFVRYPEPLRNAFASPPLGMNMAPDSTFVGGGGGGGGGSFPRRDMYPATASTAAAATPSAATAAMGFEASLYGESANYVLNGRASPGSYPDEGDMRLPSSGLSSAPSAPSSAMGSPQSNHGQLGALHEWSAHGLAVQPGIVGNDYIEYFSGTGMEDLGGFVDFQTNKTFVGTLLFSLSSLVVHVLFCLLFALPDSTTLPLFSLDMRASDSMRF